MAEAGSAGAGYESWAYRNQDDKNNWRDLALHMGRELSESPAHLSRALYISRHDRTTLHLPLYDVSARYAETVGDLPIGTSKYTVKLGLMQRPRGDGTDDIPVAYTVDFSQGGQTAGATVQYRGKPNEPSAQVDIKFDSTEETACSLNVSGSGDSDSPSSDIPMAISYPIPPSQTRDGTFKHPYYTFLVPGESGPVRFEWQIHPVQHGPLRYTLICVPQDRETPDSENMCAIYHHMGLGASLSQRFSEGVLLISPSVGIEKGTLIVASALGMLWQLRSLAQEKQQSEGTVIKDSKRHRRFGSIKKFMTRKG